MATPFSALLRFEAMWSSMALIIIWQLASIWRIVWGHPVSTFQHDWPTYIDTILWIFHRLFFISSMVTSLSIELFLSSIASSWPLLFHLSRQSMIWMLMREFHVRSEKERCYGHCWHWVVFPWESPFLDRFCVSKRVLPMGTQKVFEKEKLKKYVMCFSDFPIDKLLVFPQCLKQRQKHLSCFL